MDEESDQFLGEIYPYTYATHNRFLDKLLKDNPIGIGYLVSFLEPESESDHLYIQEFKKKIQDYKQTNKLFRIGTDKDAWGEQIPPKESQSFHIQGYDCGSRLPQKLFPSFSCGPIYI